MTQYKAAYCFSNLQRCHCRQCGLYRCRCFIKKLTGGRTSGKEGEGGNRQNEHDTGWRQLSIRGPREQAELLPWYLPYLPDLPLRPQLADIIRGLCRSSAATSTTRRRFPMGKEPIFKRVFESQERLSVTTCRGGVY